jgi:succinate dehydrogenase/fumarate reductase cytochrome b subunit
MKQYEFKNIWSSWIPTNLGILQDEFIGHHDSLSETFSEKYVESCIDDFTFSKKQEIEIADINISDTLCPIARMYNFIFYEQTKAKGKIKFNARTSPDEELTGEISINYCITSTINTSISTKFKLFENGAIFLDKIYINYNESTTDINIAIEYEHVIANALYNFLKRVVHGDNHHHAKIDTIIYVHKMPSETKFNDLESDSILCEDISLHMSKKIKLKEREIKSIKQNNCNIWLSKINIFYSLKGYLAYYKTFKFLFDTTYEEKKEPLENVLESAKVTFNKLESAIDNRKSYATHIFALVSIFIATMILTNTMLNHVDVVHVMDNNISEVISDTKNLKEEIKFKFIQISVFAIVGLIFTYMLIIKPFLCGTSVTNTKSSCMLETIRQAQGNIFTALILAFLVLAIIFVISNGLAIILSELISKIFHG